MVVHLLPQVPSARNEQNSDSVINPFFHAFKLETSSARSWDLVYITCAYMYWRPFNNILFPGKAYKYLLEENSYF